MSRPLGGFEITGIHFSLNLLIEIPEPGMHILKHLEKQLPVTIYIRQTSLYIHSVQVGEVIAISGERGIEAGKGTWEWVRSGRT